ncbi:MAG: DMT family transporter [Roseburia sp.]
MAGVLWALDTVVLGIALAMSQFVSTEQAIFLAPFVSTFLHDLFSAIWMLAYIGIRRQYGNVIHALRTRSGKFIVLGALLGGPIGMSGYVAAIHYIGPTYTAIISATFPAIGALFSYIFLKERMGLIQMAGLVGSILGVVMLGYTPGGAPGGNVILGFACALLCCIGWASEAVICAYGMKDPDIKDEHALQIRQLTSALFYGIAVLPVLRGWKFTLGILFTETAGIILLAACFGTASYLCYYRAIHRLGPTKGMALNITYSAWSLLFALLLLGAIPDVKSIFCGILIVCGSVVAASGGENR